MKIINVQLNEEDVKRLEVVKSHINTHMNSQAIRWMLLKASQKILSQNVNMEVERKED
mgnify:FL=1